MHLLRSVLFSVAVAFLAIVAVGVTLTPAKAAVMWTVSGGQLVGAQNLEVRGKVYDVTFETGTCAAVFDGCDNAADDFAFTDRTTAILAALALMETVFIDGVVVGGTIYNFDSVPSLTCPNPNSVPTTGSCVSIIPYILPIGQGGQFSAQIIAQYNRPFIANGTCCTDNDFILAQDSFAVRATSTIVPDPTGSMWAVFVEQDQLSVPEPATLGLFGIGLIGIGFAARHRKTA